MDKRTVLRLDPRLAGQGGVPPPVPARGPDSKARDLGAELLKCWNIDFDDAGAIGRRYRRQDESAPVPVMVDFGSL